MTPPRAASRRWIGGAGRLKIGIVVGAVALSLGAAPTVRARSFLPSDEVRSRTLVNSARSAAGLGTLGANGGLNSIARAQAARMADRKAIYHNPNLGPDARAAGVNWQWIGENVGVGYGVESLHSSFMSSPGHHENIVFAKYNVIGVGVVSGDDGRIYVAHVFATVAAAAPAPFPVSAPVRTPQRPASTAPKVRTEPEPAPAPPVATPPAHHAPRAEPPQRFAAQGGVVNVEVVLGESVRVDDEVLEASSRADPRSVLDVVAGVFRKITHVLAYGALSMS